MAQNYKTIDELDIGSQSDAGELPVWQGGGTKKVSFSAYIASLLLTATAAAFRAAIGIPNAMQFQGVIDASGNPNYPAAAKGDVYKISVAGKIGGAAGAVVQVSDTIYAIADVAAGNQATVGASWAITQANIDGAVTGPAAAVDSRIAAFDGTTGKLIKDSGLAVSGVLAEVSGNWVPADASGGGLTFTVGGAKYKRHAGVTFIELQMTWPVTADINSVVIGGLPDTVAAGTYGTAAITTDSGISLTARFNSNTKQLILLKNDNNAPTNLNMSGKYIALTGFYFNT